MKKLLVIALILGIAGIGCKKAKKEEAAQPPTTEQVAPAETTKVETTKVETTEAQQPAQTEEAQEKAEEAGR